MAVTDTTNGASSNSASIRFARACRGWLGDRGNRAADRLVLLSEVFQRFSNPATSGAATTDLGHEMTGPGGVFGAFSFCADEAKQVESLVTPAVLDSLYETTLPDRRRHGVYYTPSVVVRFICRQVLGTLLDEQVEKSRPGKKELRIVDPACGCGAFLVGLHLALEELSSGSELPPVHLIGVDLDNAAADITRRRLALRQKIATAGKTADRVETEVLCGDSLTMDHDAAFDIVIGNPPYGTKADPAVRDRFFPPGEGRQARDTYGLFVARALELLRPGGCMSFVLSDTWRTIKMHRPLRKRLLEQTTIRHVIDLPGWIFSAAVDTTILTVSTGPPPDQHEMVSADLRDLRNYYPGLEPALLEAAGGGSFEYCKPQARYTYRQATPLSHGNLSVSTVSPGLFHKLIDRALPRLGDSARIVQGLATGDNVSFVRKRPGGRGPYKLIDEKLILTEEDIRALTPDEKRCGVAPLRYEGRCFVPYDKGADNCTREGRLANYYLPTNYFIDWSVASVERLRTRRSQRQGGRIASRFQNADCYFVSGITWSDVGYYSPTFRLSGAGVFDVKGSRILPQGLDRHYLLGFLCSTAVRFFVKAIANHTVSTQVDDIHRIPLPDPGEAVKVRISRLVQTIIDKQQRGQYSFDHYRREYLAIEELVNRLYNLTGSETDEIRDWFRRRYPSLSLNNKD